MYKQLKILFQTLPLFVGYASSATAFGLAAADAGLSFWQSQGFSLFVFAGASQFMALALLAEGAGYPAIIVSTFFLNLRHLLMSASLSSRLLIRRFWRPLAAFTITDESFAWFSFQKRNLDRSFVLGTQYFTYFGWNLGTAFGYWGGGSLPLVVRQSSGIVLYALFVAILTPEIKKYAGHGLIALIAGGTHAALSYLTRLPPGWPLILAIIVGALAGSRILKKRRDSHG